MNLEGDDLRAKALRRSWACPGAGFALLGRSKLAISTYTVSLVALGALAWLVVDPGQTPLWITVALVFVATVLWIVEQFATQKLAPQPAKPGFLVGGFTMASAVGWPSAVLVLVLIYSRYGSLKVAGSGMYPTLEGGERALYEKRVEPERLRRGALVLYTLSDRSDWGESGLLIVARILAVPGDNLSIHDGRYVVNGETGPAAINLVSNETLTIPVPNAPETWTVPEGRYFVVQDSPTGAYDSRVLSWVEANEFISTRLYYFSARNFLRPVE